MEFTPPPIDKSQVFFYKKNKKSFAVTYKVMPPRRGVRKIMSFFEVCCASLCQRILSLRSAIFFMNWKWHFVSKDEILGCTDTPCRAKDDHKKSTVNDKLTPRFRRNRQDIFRF